MKLKVVITDFFFLFIYLSYLKALLYFPSCMDLLHSSRDGKSC